MTKFSMKLQLFCCFKLLSSYRYVKDFKKLKENLTAHLFRLYNRTVFAQKVSPGLSSTSTSVVLNPRVMSRVVTHKAQLSKVSFVRNCSFHLNLSNTVASNFSKYSIYIGYNYLICHLLQDYSLKGCITKQGPPKYRYNELF